MQLNHSAWTVTWNRFKKKTPNTTLSLAKDWLSNLGSIKSPGFSSCGQTKWDQITEDLGRSELSVFMKELQAPVIPELELDEKAALRITPGVMGCFDRKPSCVWMWSCSPCTWGYKGKCVITTSNVPCGTWVRRPGCACPVGIAPDNFQRCSAGWSNSDMFRQSQVPILENCPHQRFKNCTNLIRSHL